MKKKQIRDNYPSHDFLYSENAFIVKANQKAPLSRGDQEYDAQDMSFKQLKSFRTAIDIGARYGGWSRRMEQQFQHLEAFEPRSRWLFVYPYNIRMDKVTLHPYGLGEQEEIVPIQGNRITLNPIHRVEMIEIKTLDSFKISDVDFIKIDVDGYELPVLKGGTKTILKWKPIICMEVIPGEIFHGELADQYLQELGAKPIERCRNNVLYTWEH